MTAFIVCFTIVAVVGIVAGAITWSDERSRQSHERIKLAELAANPNRRY
jgi:hypothetical protein